MLFTSVGSLWSRLLDSDSEDSDEQQPDVIVEENGQSAEVGSDDEFDLELQSRKLDELRAREELESRLELQEQMALDAKERTFEFPSKQTLELESMYFQW